MLQKGMNSQNWRNISMEISTTGRGSKINLGRLPVNNNHEISNFKVNIWGFRGFVWKKLGKWLSLYILDFIEMKPPWIKRKIPLDFTNQFTKLIFLFVLILTILFVNSLSFFQSLHSFNIKKFRIRIFRK